MEKVEEQPTHQEKGGRGEQPCKHRSRHIQVYLTAIISLSTAYVLFSTIFSLIMNVIVWFYADIIHVFYTFTCVFNISNNQKLPLNQNYLFETNVLHFFCPLKFHLYIKKVTQS